MNTTAKQPAPPGIGTGIYTMAEAARLIKAAPGSVRRWADGHRYAIAATDTVRVLPPVIDRTNSEPGLLTFYELIELCFVREFDRCGVKLSEIRAAAQKLRDEWSTVYPFALNRIKTDGCQLLLDAGAQYRQVATCQQVFAFADEFFKDIDVDADGLAEKWWPMGREHLVVLDRHRAFGAPIEVRTGVRTEILYKAFKAEKDIAAVADWYEVPAEAVRDAINFEETWLKAA